MSKREREIDQAWDKKPYKPSPTLAPFGPRRPMVSRDQEPVRCHLGNPITPPKAPPEWPHRSQQNPMFYLSKLSTQAFSSLNKVNQPTYHGQSQCNQPGPLELRKSPVLI
ncbi:hypothetical protein FPRO04_11073 [Fusarium proliferatum]|nr:hypothetical protein FPRO03_10666 [Fusarium proliferatum]KAG4271311.1 hypothetical protein FPRO04_11073 [Fusarium proliferatum]